MPPSHAALEQAVASLKAKPGAFQRLIEDYAGLLHPETFPHLAPTGRRPDEVTVKGWPDAWALSPGGLAVVEATHSDEWEDHLRDDVGRAEARSGGGITALLFAAWAKAPDPSRLLAYRQRLVALGIPPERALLVFREQLVRDLAQPRFARLWVEQLGLPVTCLPFDPIEEARHLFGSEEQVGLSAPRRSEYRQALVHRPALAEEVEQRLARAGWALVRGRGASGKTVLALSVALGGAYSGQPVYYLDLADLQAGNDVSAAAEVLATYGDRGVLFILDNVHLEAHAAGRLYDAWHGFADGSHLLLLGRLVTPEPDRRGRQQLLEDLDRDALVLEVGTADLLGVYRRLSRRPAANPVPAEPPARVLESWLQLFGGDLLAFSAAVVRRLLNLMRWSWELRPQDARDYVQSEYLAELPTGEVDLLARLAVLAQLEVAATIPALGGRLPDGSLKKGLVLRTQHGREQIVRLRLVHPGMGDLLLAALPPLEPMQALCAMAAADSFCGITIAVRLKALGRNEEARGVLQAIADSPAWFSSSFSPWYLPRTASLFAEYGVLTLGEFERRLLSRLPEISSATTRTPLHLLPSFFKYARTALPGLHENVLKALGSPENLETLIESALRTPLGDLASFLQYARTALPGLHENLRKVLDSPENLPTLTGSALRTPLHFLPFFLQYASTALPGLHENLCRALGSPENLPTLTESALRTPLGDLASFLQYASTALPGFDENLRKALDRPENLPTLTESALRTPLHFLPSFFQYARTSLPELHENLRKALDSPGNLPALTESAMRTPLGDLASFLQYARTALPELHENLCKALDSPENLQTLTESALRTPLDHLAFFLQYASTALPGLHENLRKALDSPENFQTLTESALRTPLDHLAFFFQYAGTALPQLYGAIAEALGQHENQQTLIEAALRTPLEHLASFVDFTRTSLPELHAEICRILSLPDMAERLGQVSSRTRLEQLSPLLHTDIGPALLATFVDEQWEKRWAAEPDMLLGAIPSATTALARLGRPELRTALIRRAMNPAHRAAWRRPDATLYTLASCLRVAREVGEPVADEFLASVATSRWLEVQYQKTDIGLLAYILFNIWAGLDGTRLARFATPRLLTIVKKKLYSFRQPTALAEVLSLLGAGMLLGLDIPPPALSWIQGSHLHQALATRMPDPEMAELNAPQVQLWLGLREVARKSRGPLRIAAQTGQVFLSLWRQAAPGNEKLRQLNSLMISWLERCERARWTLVPDWTPLP